MVADSAVTPPGKFFFSALAECSHSLISNANLISKVYFLVMQFRLYISAVDFSSSIVP